MQPASVLDVLLKPESDDLGSEEQLSLIAQEPVLGDLGGRGERSAGRPKGAKNKRLSDLARYILSRHRNPVEAAAEIVDAPLVDLANHLQCSKLEAAEYWRKCAEFVARYTLQPMPQAVKVQTEVDGYITLINLSAPRAGEEDVPLSSHGLAMKLLEDQQVSGDSLEDHATDSHEPSAK